MNTHTKKLSEYCVVCYSSEGIINHFYHFLLWISSFCKNLDSNNVLHSYQEKKKLHIF